MKEKSVIEMAKAMLKTHEQMFNEDGPILRPFEKKTYEALIGASKIILGLVQGRIDSVPKGDKWLKKYAEEK